MALVGLLHKSAPLGEATYLALTQTLHIWCHVSHLEINMARTKALITCTKQRSENSFFDCQVSPAGQHVETVENLKCLGIFLDSPAEPL